MQKEQGVPDGQPPENLVMVIDNCLAVEVTALSVGRVSRMRLVTRMV